MAPRVRDGRAHRLRLRDRLAELTDGALDVPEIGDDAVDIAVGLPRRLHRSLEVPLLQGSARLLEEGDGCRQVGAEALGRDELVPALVHDAKDSLKLSRLELLESLTGKGRAVLVSAFLDRLLRLAERGPGGGRVRPEMLRPCDPLGEVRGLAVEPLLKGLLPLCPALLEGVERLLELELLHVRAGALDELRHLRYVRPDLLGGLDEPLRIEERTVEFRSQLPGHGLEALLREPHRHLEVVRLHRGPGAGQEVLHGPGVATQVPCRDDQALGPGKGAGQVLLEDLLAPLPHLLREVDRRLEVLRAERLSGPRDGRLALRGLGAQALRHRNEARARVHDSLDPVLVDPVRLVKGDDRLVQGELVILRGHRGGGLGKRRVRLRRDGVDATGGPDQARGGL